MGDFFGDLERVAADLYPWRWPILAGLLIAAALGAWNAFKSGLLLRAWRQRIVVGSVGGPLLVVVMYGGYQLGSPLFTNVTVDEELPLGFRLADGAAPSDLAATAMPTATPSPTQAPTPPSCRRPDTYAERDGNTDVNGYQYADSPRRCRLTWSGCVADSRCQSNAVANHDANGDAFTKPNPITHIHTDSRLHVESDPDPRNRCSDEAEGGRV